jgi:hypothetical protein
VVLGSGSCSVAAILQVRHEFIQFCRGFPERAISSRCCRRDHTFARLVAVARLPAKRKRDLFARKPTDYTAFAEKLNNETAFVVRAFVVRGAYFWHGILFAVSEEPFLEVSSSR